MRIKSTVYLVGNIIYNIYFHPLSGVPGPKWAAASQVPIALVSWKGGLTYWLRDLHEKYDSDAVRVSPHEVSLISPSAWKDIYAHHSGQRPFQKDLVLYGEIKDIVTANDTDHARMRRSLNHGFSEKALREQEPLIQTYVDTLFSQIRTRVQDNGDRPVNMTNWFNWFTMDLISDLSFGESFDCLHKPECHPYIGAIELALKHVMLLSQAKRFSPVAWFLRRFVPRDATKARSEFIQWAVERTTRRMESVTTHPDFIGYILEHNDKKGLTDPEIKSLGPSLIIAGSETTASLLSAAVYLLLIHPDCHRKVRKEVRDRFKDKEDMTLETIIADLPYLQAVINESLRVYPPGIMGQPRLVPPDGASISGNFYPPGTTVQMNVYAANHASRNFSAPDEFIPERWMGDERFVDDRRDAMQPFSIGARNCVGKK